MERKERLVVLTKLAEEKTYGGAKFELPDTHKAGMISEVGFSCNVCKWLDVKDDGPHCLNKYWIAWNSGESRLPVDDPEIYCSDFFEPNQP